LVDQEYLQRKQKIIDDCVYKKKLFIQKFNESIKEHSVAKSNGNCKTVEERKHYGVASVNEYYWTSINDCGENSVEKMMNNFPDIKRLENSAAGRSRFEEKETCVNFQFI
jgi:hypothetical protein